MKFMSNNFLKDLKIAFPKSWTELSLVSDEVLKSSSATSSLVVEELPFDLAFGILLRFFKENELEFDYDNLQPKDYPSEIYSIFANFENTISHYS